MPIVISTRPKDLQTGYLRLVAATLRTEAVDEPILVPEYHFTENAAVSPSTDDVEVVDVMKTREDLDRLQVRVVDEFLITPEGRALLPRLGKMLNRHDFTGTFRLLDREMLVFEAILRTFDFLQTRTPSAVVFLTTPHLFGDYLLFEVSKFLGIKTLFFQPVPVAPVMIPHYDIGVRKTPERPLSADVNSSDFVLGVAQSRIQGLFDGMTPHYVDHQVSRAELAQRLAGRLRALVAIFGWLSKPRFPESLDFSGLERRDSLYKNALRIYLNESLARDLRKRASEFDSEVLGEKFALLALHYEPERTSFPDGLPIDSQLQSVLRARAIVPLEQTLVVKEHSSQVSPALRGYLGRSPNFYATVASLPNTLMLGPQKNTRNLFNRVSAVFTLTGTIGIEAASEGIPVGYFGFPWWQGMPGTVRVESATKWKDLVSIRNTDRSLVEGFLQEVLLRATVPGIAGEDVQDYVSRNGSVATGLLEEMAAAISREILYLVAAETGGR